MSQYGRMLGKGTATFMIGGEICTRSCKFCNTQTGRPLPLDPEEPTHVAESIQLMKLSHAVITSVDREDVYKRQVMSCRIELCEKARKNDNKNGI